MSNEFQEYFNQSDMVLRAGQDTLYVMPKSQVKPVLSDNVEALHFKNYDEAYSYLKTRSGLQKIDVVKGNIFIQQLHRKQTPVWLQSAKRADVHLKRSQRMNAGTHQHHAIRTAVKSNTSDQAFLAEAAKLLLGGTVIKQAKAPPANVIKPPPTPAAPQRPQHPRANSFTTTNPACPTDIQLDAPCNIILAGSGRNGRVQIKASELPGFSGGKFRWTTTSTKIKLINLNGPTVIVEGLDTVSSGRDAEEITVTRFSHGCKAFTKSVKVTVAKVTFSESPLQRYGYDNFDTPKLGESPKPEDFLDDHISVKERDHTFLKVDITGGAVRNDYDFVCVNTGICLPVKPPPSTNVTFDLRLNAKLHTKASTVLHAKVKCPSAQSFAKLGVHVYKEKVLDVVVAKIDHPTSPQLRFDTEDYAAHEVTANEALKEAVVKFDMTNYETAPTTTTPVTFASGTGVMEYDINALDGGSDLVKIRRAMTRDRDKIQVAVVRELKSYYYLSAAAEADDTTIKVRGTRTFFTRNYVTTLGSGSTQEPITVRVAVGNVVTLSRPLVRAHAIGERVEFLAGAWATSPVIIQEGTDTVDTVRWTILHEVGHLDNGLKLDDIIDDTNFMHFQQSWTDYRLRYCPRKKQYEDLNPIISQRTDTENQWEKIPR